MWCLISTVMYEGLLLCVFVCLRVWVCNVCVMCLCALLVNVPNDVLWFGCCISACVNV